MILKPIKANVNVLEFEKDGVKHQVLFSYQTPVAYTKEWKDGGFIARRTSKHYSRTTTKHINQWFGTVNHCECEQEEINNVVNEVK